MSDFPEPPAPFPPPPPPGLTPPPGYVGYGEAGAAMPRQRVGGVAKGLTVVLAVFVPLAVIALIAQIMLASKANDYLDGAVSESSFRDTYDSLVSLTILPSAITIALAVLTVIWMFRIARNLQSLGRVNATWTPGWAIGGWFLPPCGIYAIPWLMMRELWKGSDPASPPGDPNWKQNRVSPLVNVWWVLFGLVPVITFIGSASSFADFSKDVNSRDLAKSLDGAVPLAVLDAASKIGAAVVLILIVRQLTANHRRLTGES